MTEDKSVIEWCMVKQNETNFRAESRAAISARPHRRLYQRLSGDASICPLTFVSDAQTDAVKREIDCIRRSCGHAIIGITVGTTSTVSLLIYCTNRTNLRNQSINQSKHIYIQLSDAGQRRKNAQRVQFVKRCNRVITFDLRDLTRRSLTK